MPDAAELPKSLLSHVTAAASLGGRRRFSVARRRRRSDRFERPVLIVAAQPNGGVCLYIGRADETGYTYGTFELSRAEATRVSQELQRLLNYR